MQENAKNTSSFNATFLKSQVIYGNYLEYFPKAAEYMSIYIHGNEKNTPGLCKIGVAYFCTVM